MNDRTLPMTEQMRRQERILMAKEICSHRGENPNSVDRGGNEGWEKYEPLAGACIREAERLFALRNTDKARTSPEIETLAECFDADELRGYSPIRNFTSKERRIIAAALRKSDLTPTPGLPLRYCDYCKSWNSKPCGEQCVWTPDMPTLETLKGPNTSTDRANRFCKNAACHWPDCVVEGGVCGSIPESSTDREESK